MGASNKRRSTKNVRVFSDSSMGNALNRAKKVQQNEVRDALSHANPNSIHTTDSGAAALQSVWETSDLQNFFATAEQNQKDFTAERNVRMVEGTHLFQRAKEKPLDNRGDNVKWFELSKKLPIPVRPKWDHTMTKGDIDEHERDAFLAWRRRLAVIEEKEGVMMTPYEKNLEVWRQLWRVVERSDVVVNILDARNPLAFRSKATEDCVLSAKKKLVLLLNKAELLTEKQRLAWGKYFKDQGITALFFSAIASKEKQEEETGTAAPKGREGKKEALDAGGEDTVALDQLILHHEHQEEAEAELDALDEAMPDTVALLEEMASESRKPAAKKSRRNNKKLKGAPPMKIGQGPKGPHNFAEEKRDTAEKQPELPEAPTDSEKERSTRVDPVVAMGGVKVALKYHEENLSRIYTADELTDFFLLHRKSGTLMDGKPVMIGFIGYPNVGKSSTINVLWESKKVNVSATPGKTKHFQTLILPEERRVMLCDCPGLVFPSFASTRDHMVVDGVLPISQLKDALTPMRILDSRIRKEIFEMRYTINLEWTNDKDESPTAYHLLCNQYARARGLMTDHDKPNISRAARAILQDYVSGTLVWVAPPPGLTSDDIEVTEVDDEEWEEFEECEEDEECEEEECEEDAESEDSGPGEVDWHDVLPNRAPEKKKELTTEQKFNMANIGEEEIYAKMTRPKTKKEKRINHQVEAEVRDMNDEGQYVVEVSDDDCIEEVVGPEIVPGEKPMTKRQMRMMQKNQVRGRVGNHHNKGVQQEKGAQGYSTVFRDKL